MTIPLLKTKLYIPPIRADLLERPRLVARLNAGLDCRLTLISAPAGFGKTTLISSWIHGSDSSSKAVVESPQAAWISLDAGDNDPIRYVTYLIAALRTVAENIGESALDMLKTINPPADETVLVGLINEISELPDRFILVLDDYHAITDERVHAITTFLIENQPPQLHIVISSRSDPPWPYARLRGRGEINEIRVNELRFTPEESADFLNEVMGLELSPENIAALEERTEGWIAGLQMAALSIQGRKLTQGDHAVTTFVQAFAGSNRFVLDYLLEEVLNQQSSEIQAFLLQTSILERLTAPLCDAVTQRDDSQEILTGLDQANLFVIPLDDERRWYRYHHLFADLLRSVLGKNFPNYEPHLHRRASVWFEVNQLIVDAVSHALAAGETERVASLVEGNAALAMMDYGELNTLINWLDTLPQEVACSRPWLCVFKAWALVYTGQLQAVEPLLQTAEKLLVVMQDLEQDKGANQSEDRTSQIGQPSPGIVAVQPVSESERKHILGNIFAIRAYVAELRGDFGQAIECARTALEILPGKDLMARSSAASVLGAVLRMCGDLEAANQALDEAKTLRQAAGDSQTALFVNCSQAYLQFIQGKLRSAEAAFKKVLHLSEIGVGRGGRTLPIKGYAHTRLSAIYREWNDVESAAKHAVAGLEISKQWGQADVLVYGFIEHARTLQVQGRKQEALSAFQEAREMAVSVSPWFGSLVEAWEAHLHVLQGNLEPASRWAQRRGLNYDDDFEFPNESEYRTLARLLIEKGRAEPDNIGQALQLLERLLDMNETAGANNAVLEILLLNARGLAAIGNQAEALGALEQALLFAQPERYVRTFIDEGDEIRAMLQKIQVNRISQSYINELISAQETRTGVAAMQEQKRSAVTVWDQLLMVEPLSERELQVLRLMDSELSSPEIADELIIAVSTVRSHIKNIYSKLGVHSRYEAVEKARQMSLI